MGWDWFLCHSLLVANEIGVAELERENVGVFQDKTQPDRFAAYPNPERVAPRYGRLGGRVSLSGLFHNAFERH